MGYNIEVSFSLIKNSNITAIHDKIELIAIKYGCSGCYEDYEYEIHTKFPRKHCILTINFNDPEINDLIKFINEIKNNKELYIELIYDDNYNQIVYASKYYVSKKMNNISLKTYIEKKNKTRYTDNNIKIIEIMNKLKQRK